MPDTRIRWPTFLSLQVPLQVTLIQWYLWPSTYARLDIPLHFSLERSFVIRLLP
jgi:hypothetical protein